MGGPLLHSHVLAQGAMILKPRPPPDPPDPPSPALFSPAPQVVDSLLDEVVGAGVERSVDPTLLEPAVLDRILSSMEGS